MSLKVDFCLNRATEQEIADHLSLCDAGFVPPLSSRVEIGGYARKIFFNAVKFEAWEGRSLVGLVALYCDDAGHRLAYITSVSVLAKLQGNRVASRLMEQCLDYLRDAKFESVELDVDKGSAAAIHIYERYGFVANKAAGRTVTMRLDLGRKQSMGEQRNYDDEIKDSQGRQYAYGFDFDVMHPYMLQAFAPFFNTGSLLELGSFKGDFTGRLLSRFADITCVEVSATAMEEARGRLGDKVTFVKSTFESLVLPRRYDNVVLTHVLEHLDDPVHILRRLNEEWLADGGRLFLVCPNANAPSRQIAVKMGLIPHNAAVTPAEAEHGHRRTYSLDTLERDAVAGGLKVVHRTGIFFKALANFQWDRLLRTDIISKDYLDGCYKLGQLYPDLCSSIFLLCEKGDR